MKSTTFKILLSLGVLFILIFFISKLNQPLNSEISQKDLIKEYPSEWMYNQRAYPNNYINTEAIENAIVQSKGIKSNRSIQGNDWALIGPLNTGGRITDVAISPVNDDVLYVSTAVGGVFKSINRGDDWEPIFDDNAKPSIGNIAIAPSNPEKIYVGTGEANGSATSGAFFGNGVYSSDNGGTTWNHLGLEETNHIGRIVVDPTDEDRVFVAASGKLYDKNIERGVYRTTNGGSDWDQVLFVTDSTSAIDIVINPVNTDILFAAMWERTRKPWQRDYGGETSAIHRSVDGGDTWEELGASQGLPAASPDTGRIGIAISESDPNIIYARYTTNEITNTFNGLYKSIDNGDNWDLVSLGEISDVDSSFGWYFGNVRIHPTNPDEVYVLGQQIYKTTNSGGNWQSVGGMHVDHHALEYSRNNTNFILAGNDGGAYISENAGGTWSKFTNLPITQFYNIEVDFQQPERLYGGTQDNNTIRTLTGGANDWSSIIGGDGFHVNVDPTDNNFVYGESQWGNLRRSTNGGDSFQGATDGISNGDRVNWNTPVVLSPFNSELAYYGSNRLYTSNRAVFWTAISEDLTNGQHPSGSLSYGTLTAIAPSYLNESTVYTGSDDGNIHVTFDGGITWNNISGSLPNRYVTSIAISPNDDLVAYATFSGFSVLDYTPHIFKTEDGGQNWTDISSNLPSIPVNDVILHTSQDLIFIATDLNVWYSQNDGGTWDILGNDLPFTIIRDLKLHEPTDELYAGTFGRSMHSYNISAIILSNEDEIFSSEKIKVYPNPASSEFTIEANLTALSSILMYDVNGKLVKSISENEVAPFQNINVNVEGIQPGVYFIKLNSKEQSISKKIIVK
ncbi:MAG: photosystem II stability/assembly factor-like uncharacterized protein [Flavobacteriaceae bacterium]|jgi:photosystem II stability/assembly factor-like uncharacterized protein